MRWDNPIESDWFTLPDLASFPDYADEPRNTSDYDLGPLNNLVRRNEITPFVKEVAKFAGECDWLGYLSNQMMVYAASKYRSGVDAENLCSSDLFETGLHVTDIDTSKIGLDPLVKDLLEKPDWNPQPGSYDRGVYVNEDVKRVLFDEFRKAGIIEGVARYSGKIRRIAGAYLHVSKPTDKHYKQFFMDATTTPRWTNTHIDPKEDVVKAIVYLNDVHEDNGAFGYVPKSNRFMHQPAQEILGRVISTRNYCKTPEERASVFALPAPMRVSYNFGRCIMDDSQLAADMDKYFVRVTSSMGNVSVFDAGAGMHQGGICKEGYRASLQVLMK